MECTAFYCLSMHEALMTVVQLFGHFLHFNYNFFVVLKLRFISVWCDLDTSLLLLHLRLYILTQKYQSDINLFVSVILRLHL